MANGFVIPLPRFRPIFHGMMRRIRKGRPFIIMSGRNRPPVD
jgi:fructoselysine-6-P-deglycase FrlB-like protein